MARLYVSHFIQVLNLAVIRSEIRSSHKEYYGLEPQSCNVPDLSSETQLASWGRKIIDGETRRLSQGGTPIYNPTIAKVKVHYDIFMDSGERQKEYQEATARSLEALSSMRAEADELIWIFGIRLNVSSRRLLRMKRDWTCAEVMGWSIITVPVKSR